MLVIWQINLSLSLSLSLWVERWLIDNAYSMAWCQTWPVVCSLITSGQYCMRIWYQRSSNAKRLIQANSTGTSAASHVVSCYSNPQGCAERKNVYSIWCRIKCQTEYPEVVQCIQNVIYGRRHLNSWQLMARIINAVLKKQHFEVANI